MEDMKSRRDQRKYQRHPVGGSVYAVWKSPSFRIGSVVDISKGGVAFHYVSVSDDDRAVPEGSVRLDVFENRSLTYISGVQCNIIYDIQVPEKTWPSSVFQVRRCGAGFRELTSEHHSQLSYFIKSFGNKEI
jgi:hypothetical protein